MKPEILLLASPSPILRKMVLQYIYMKPETDPEIEELDYLSEQDPVLLNLLENQQENGSWIMHDYRWTVSSGSLIMTAMALARLIYLGLSKDDPAIKRGINYLFEQQCPDGSWESNSYQDSESEGYTWIPLKTALPLFGIAASGCATDKRAEKAYDWLMSRQLPEGAWPAGLKSGNYAYIAGYRKMPHSKLGCRVNTTAALMAVAMHPARRKESRVKNALDLLLARETEDKRNIGFHQARFLGFEPVHGVFTLFARYDPLLTLWLCSKIGATSSDIRVKNLIDLITASQSESGLFEYSDRPEASQWISFEIMRLLKSIKESGEWQPMQPRTPFQAYPGEKRRF